VQICFFSKRILELDCLLSLFTYVLVFCFVQFFHKMHLGLFFGRFSSFGLVFQVYLFVFTKKPGIAVTLNTILLFGLNLVILLEIAFNFSYCDVEMYM